VVWQTLHVSKVMADMRESEQCRAVISVCVILTTCRPVGTTASNADWWYRCV